jgi:hypothetical protein
MDETHELNNGQKKESYERGDDRWQRRQSRRDWLILVVMIVLYLTWTGVVFLFEPGIR